MKLFHSVVLASCVVCAFAAPSKPHLVMVLQDDLGHYDTGITNPTNLNVTANITQLSREGIVLEQHYVRQENIGAPSRASQRLFFFAGLLLVQSDATVVPLRQAASAPWRAVERVYV
jgi:hypothetical protein